MGRIINVQKLRWKNRKRKNDRKNGTREGGREIHEGNVEEKKINNECHSKMEKQAAA